MLSYPLVCFENKCTPLQIMLLRPTLGQTVQLVYVLPDWLIALNGHTLLPALNSAIPPSLLLLTSDFKLSSFFIALALLVGFS